MKTWDELVESVRVDLVPLLPASDRADLASLRAAGEDWFFVLFAFMDAAEASLNLPEELVSDTVRLITREGDAVDIANITDAAKTLRSRIAA